MDRWYAQFQLFDDIVAAGSSYACRVRDNSSFKVLEQRELSAAAQAAQIVFDAVVELGDEPRRRPKHPVRLVMVQVTPHEKRSNRKGNTGAGPSDGLLRIATNLLDEPTVAGIVCNLRDISEQVAAENELKRQARRDPLTGLPKSSSG